MNDSEFEPVPLSNLCVSCRSIQEFFEKDIPQGHENFYPHTLLFYKIEGRRISTLFSQIHSHQIFVLNALNLYPTRAKIFMYQCFIISFATGKLFRTWQKRLFPEYEKHGDDAIKRNIALLNYSNVSPITLSVFFYFTKLVVGNSGRAYGFTESLPV